MSAVSSKPSRRRAGETPGQGLREGPSPTRGQGAQGIRAESPLKMDEPPAPSGPFPHVPSLKSLQYQEAPGTPGHQPSPVQDPWLPCPLPSLILSPYLTPTPHWRSLASIGFWKFPSHVRLPSHQSTSVSLAGKMQTPLQGHLQTPLLQLSPDTGGLTWLVKCSIWEGVSIIQKLTLESCVFAAKAG